MRQFAVLIHDPEFDVECKKQIKEFISNTLHANPHVILDDVYYQGQNSGLKGIGHVAEAMRIDLAYHPSLSPAKLLDSCIESYVTEAENDEQEEPYIFGDSRCEHILSRLKPQTNELFFEDITKFINE